MDYVTSIYKHKFSNPHSTSVYSIKVQTAKKKQKPDILWKIYIYNRLPVVIYGSMCNI